MATYTEAIQRELDQASGDDLDRRQQAQAALRKPLSQCLFEAADIIEKNGWVQGIYDNLTYDFDNLHKPPIIQHCMAGAIREACPDHWPTETWSQRDITATALGFKNFDALFEYNDKKGRRAIHVINRLRRYAAKLAKKGE